MNENPNNIVNKVSNLVTGTIEHACIAINGKMWFIVYKLKFNESIDK